MPQTHSNDLPELPGPDTHPNRLICAVPDPDETEAEIVERLAAFWDNLLGMKESSVFDTAEVMSGPLGEELARVLAKLFRAGVQIGLVYPSRLVTRVEDGRVEVQDMYTAGTNNVLTTGPLARFRVLDFLITGEAPEGMAAIQVRRDSNEGAILTGLVAGHGKTN